MIALVVFTKQHQMIGTGLRCFDFFIARRVCNIDLTANNGLDACLFTSLIKFHNTVHRTVIGNGYRSVSALGSTRRDILDPASTVKQTVFTMQMQVYKFVCHEISFLRQSRNFPVSF